MNLARSVDRSSSASGESAARRAPRPRPRAGAPIGPADGRRILVRRVRAATADNPPLPRTSRFRRRPWQSDGQRPPARARRQPRIAETTFERIYGAFIAARAALGVALIVTLALAGCSACGRRRRVAASASPTRRSRSACGCCRAFAAAPRRRRSRVCSSPQWLATIGADLVCFTALHLARAGSSLNYQALLVLPVLMAGVLTPRVLALATAAPRRWRCSARAGSASPPAATRRC